MHAVIIGGGFAGVHATKNLLKYGFKVTLFSKTNYFLFTPLLHEVATGTVNRHNIVQPIREIITHKNFEFIRSEVQKVEVNKKKVLCEDSSVDYNYLVLCIGAKTNYYNVKGAEENSLDLKTVQDSIRIRDYLINSLEMASQTNNQKYLNFVIIGAGATGVQLTGSISNFVNDNIKKFYPHLSPPKIYLIQAIKDIIPIVHEDCRNIAKAELKKKGIILMTESPVTEVGNDFVVIKNHKKIKASTIIWAGGVTPNYILTQPKIQNDRGFFPIDSYLRVNGYKNIFAIGDCAFHEDNPVPQLAQVAIKQGKLVAENINNSIKKRPLKDFKFKNSGILISIGEGFAIGELFILGKSFKVKGRLLWFMKRTIYLMNLVGFQNKVRVGIEWLLNLIFPRDTSEI